MHEIFLILVTSVLPHRGNAYGWQRLRGLNASGSGLPKTAREAMQEGEIFSRLVPTAELRGTAAGDAVLARRSDCGTS